MLPDIKKVDNFGKFEEIIYVLNHIITNQPKYITDIKKHGLENNVFRRIPILNILTLLDFLALIKVKDDKVLLTKKGQLLKSKLIKTEKLNHIFTIILIKKILNNSQLSEVFSVDNIIFNTNKNLYSIKQSSIPIRFANIRNLLIEIGFFQYDESNHCYLFFNDTYLEIIKEEIKKLRKTKSFNQMKKEMEKAERYGIVAELFVLEYERMRLKKHQKKDEIKIISDIDVAAGYDIVSFSNLDSKSLDRFIEVKSFEGKKSFYWSENEIKTSKRLKEKYFLYLVNRSEIDNKGYKPTIIENPYKEFFLTQEDFWIRHPISWYFEMVNFQVV